MSPAAAAAAAAPSASASLAPGQRPPLFTVTATDKSGVIVIVTAFCLALAVVATFVRGYVRFRITSQRLAWDDGIIGAAVLVYIGQAVLVFHEVHEGFGKAIADVRPDKLIDIQKSLYSDGFLYILTVWLSKLSTVFLYLRLSRKQNHRAMNFAIIGTIGLTFFISFLLVALRCNLSRPWVYFTANGTTCTNLISRWQVVASFDILTEVFLGAAAIILVYGLQMDVSKKTSVIFAFDVRLLIIVPIALRLYYFSGAYNTADPTLRATTLTVVTQIEMACALVLASVPTLRPFMIATATHYGAPAEGATTHAASGKNHTSSAASFNLRNLASRFRNATTGREMQVSNNSLNDGYVRESPVLPGAHDYQSHANATAARTYNNGTRGSDDSTEAIITKDGIRKDVQYVVQYGDGQ